GTAAGGGVGAGGSPARGRRGVAHGTPDARRGGGAVRDAPAGEPGGARGPLGLHGGGGRLAAAREAGRSGVRAVARVAAGQASARLRGSPRVRRPRGCAGRRGSGVRAVARVAVAELVLPARPA